MHILIWSVHMKTWRSLMQNTERNRELEGVRLPNTENIEVKDWATLHYHIDEGYSASALVTMFGLGLLTGCLMLTLLWTHLPW